MKTFFRYVAAVLYFDCMAFAYLINEQLYVILVFVSFIIGGFIFRREVRFSIDFLLKETLDLKIEKKLRSFKEYCEQIGKKIEIEARSVVNKLGLW